MKNISKNQLVKKKYEILIIQIEWFRLTKVPDKSELFILNSEEEKISPNFRIVAVLTSKHTLLLQLG